MKKKAFEIVTLCISLFAAVALVGCGGSGGATGSGGGGGTEKPAVDMRTDCIWFKVEVPAGVEIIDVDGGSVYVRIDNVEEHKDAVETMMKSLEFADDIAKAKTEAMDVKLDDIEIKR